MNTESMTPILQPSETEQTRFHQGMKAQLRLIAIYRWQQFLITGQLLTMDDAAKAWIACYAESFRDSFIA